MLNKLDELEEVDRKRTWCQEMAADDPITLDVLRARLAELDTTRRIVVHVVEAGLWAATLIPP